MHVRTKRILSLAAVGGAGLLLGTLVLLGGQSISPEHALEGRMRDRGTLSPLPVTTPPYESELMTEPAALPADRQPVDVSEEAALSPADPCEGLRAANAKLLDENARLLDEIDRLRVRIELLRAHGGTDPYSHFLRSPDAELLSDEDQKWLKGVMSWECPFYLRPGEALYLVEAGNDPRIDDFEEHMIRYLGPERVLREAPPEWMDRKMSGLTEEEWESIFGEPMPAR